MKEKFLEIKRIIGCKNFEITNYVILTIFLLGSCFLECFAWIVLFHVVLLSVVLNYNNLLKLIVYLVTFKLCLFVDMKSHQIDLKNIAIIILMISLSIRFFIQLIQKKKKITLKVFLPALIFIVYLGVLCCTGFNLIVILGYLMIVFSCYLLYEIREDINISEIIMFLCLGVIVSTLFSFCEPISSRLDNLLVNYSIYGMNKISGMLSNPNILVLYSCLALSGLLYLKVNQKITNLNFFLLFIPLVIFGINTISRNFVIVLALSSFLFIIFYIIKFKKRAFKFVMLFIVSIFAISGIFMKATKANFARLKYSSVEIEAGETLNPTQDNNKDFNELVFAGLVEYDPGRIGIWKLYLTKIMENNRNFLIGSGLDAPNIGQRAAHNFLLQVVYHTGIIGLLMLILLMLSLINWRRIKILYKQYTKLSFFIPCAFMMMIESCLGNFAMFILISLILADEKIFRKETQVDMFCEEIVIKEENVEDVMKANEKVSVILPIYKVEQYLNDCLQSVTNQTYQNLEIILVDDGSPDNCPKMCDDWAKKDSRIKVVHKTNGGASSARNAGLQIAKGKYVYFCDSDDFIDKDTIEKLVGGIVGSELAICGYKIIKDDKIVKKSFSHLKDADTKTIIKELMHSWDLGLLWNKLFIRSLITEKFNEDFKIREDLNFNINYLKHVKRISIIKYELYNYVKRESSLTSSIKTVDISQLGLEQRLMLDVLNEKCFHDLIPHQNAVFLKGFVNLLKPFLETKFTKQDKEKFIKLMETQDVKMALQDYKCVDIKEKVFLFLLNKKQFKLLIKLIKLLMRN